MAQPHWTGYSASIPKDVQQVVLFASGVTGIAPMLQTIHTLLEARRGDGIKGRTSEVHVVWFKQHLERVDENGMAPSYGTSFEDSTVDKIASAELERLRLIHRDKLVVESVDVGGTFAQVSEVIESTPQQQQQRRDQTFLSSWGASKTVDDFKMVFISGSRSFAESLSGHEDGSYAEDGLSILTRAEKAGWRVLDLSKMKVCT